MTYYDIILLIIRADLASDKQLPNLSTIDSALQTFITRCKASVSVFKGISQIQNTNISNNNNKSLIVSKTSGTRVRSQKGLNMKSTDSKLVDNQVIIDSCANCLKNSTKTNLKMCSGCSSVSYCSKSCQVSYFTLYYLVFCIYVSSI